MDALTIEALGISKEEAAERVIDKLADRLMHETATDEDGFEHRVRSDFARTLDKTIMDKINSTVTAVADKEIAPRIAEIVEGTTLQATNQWGEKTGNAVTFREYLVQRAESYMTEQVDYQGKPKGTDSFSWKARSTRVAHMVHQHLHYEIERAMKEALGNLNSTVAKGLHEATRIAISEVLGGLKVKVETK